jgi:hypothetical protein
MVPCLEWELTCHSRITDHIRKFGATPQEQISIVDKVVLWDADEYGDEQLDQIPMLPHYQEVRSFLLDSSAYKLLCEQTRSAATLTESKHSAKDKISRTMVDLLTKPIKARPKPVKTYEIYLTLDWDLFGFLRSQYHDNYTHITIGDVIVITGASVNAQATTCAQYMNQVWPSTGKELLRALQQIISIETSGEPFTGETPCTRRYVSTAVLVDGTEMEIDYGTSQMSIIAHGNQATLVELCEQLAWLGSALRPGLASSGITLTTPSINGFIFEVWARACLHISFTNTLLRSHSDAPDHIVGSCWHAIFRNPTVVQGFPILARDNGQTGLQIPFNMLHTLAETPCLTTYQSAIVLKGLVTMLVPTDMTARSITWHFLHNKDG